MNNNGRSTCRASIPPIRYWIFCLFFAAATRVSAQQNNRFTHYSVNDGLSQSTISDITQDENGFLWAGTSDGLCRFDGYSFKSYRHSSRDAASIGSSKGYHFFIDRDKHFWVIAHNGISLYNSGADNFSNLLSYEPRDVVSADNDFLGEDGQYIYAGLCNYGLVRINKQNHKIDKLPIPGYARVEENHSWYHGFIEDGKLWVAANELFFVYDLQTRRAKRITVTFDQLVNMNAGLVLGVEPGGLVLLDKHNLTIKHINLAVNGADPAINAVTKLSDTVAMLCSSQNGISFFNTRSNTITKHISNTGGEASRALTASCAYTDWSGNLWIGSNGDGLYKLAYPFKKFRLYRSPATNNSVNSIYVSGDQLYIGNSINGLDIFSRNAGFRQNVVLNKNMPSLLNMAIVSSPISKDQSLMVAMSPVNAGSNKFFVFNRQTGKVQLFSVRCQQMFDKYWSRANLRQFVFKSGKNSWLMNTGEYLLSFNRDSGGEFYPAVVRQFAGENLSCCFRDHAGNLWIGTYKGLFIQKDSVWTAVPLPLRTEIKTINQDNAGNMWLGTNAGIYLLNAKQQLIHTYTEDNGLSNGHIYGILKDNDGNMWFSHNKGLSVFYAKTKTFSHFGAEDGLQSAEFNSGAAFKADDGELFFGGIYGTTSFFPRDILENSHAPKPRVTSILLSEEPYNAAGSAYWNVHSITLPYSDNSLSFEFTMTEFTEPLKNAYAYNMAGIDTKWINSGNMRFARYAGLRPGHYVFKIKAANSDGVWSTPQMISINIIPPLWQRGWFIFMEAMAGVGVIALVIFMIQKSVYKKKLRVFELQQKIQSERERISRDLHDNMGTQLSLMTKSIKELIHPLHGTTDEEKSQKLVSVRESSVEVMDILRETIWALNKEEITLEEFSDNVKAFVQKKLASYPGIIMDLTESDDNASVILSSTEALNLFRICQEALTNTMKYAGATILKIAIVAENGKYKISLSDNGAGFNKSKIMLNGHYGLENMRYRADEIQCLFSIDTKRGLGTSVNIYKK